jgi:hypothetical protein
MPSTGDSRQRSFWQAYELRLSQRCGSFSGEVDDPQEDATNDEELAGRLAPHEREVLLMHRVYGVPLREVALAFVIPLTEAEQLFDSACPLSARSRAFQWKRASVTGLARCDCKQTSITAPERFDG